MAYFRCTGGGGGSQPVLITKNITQNGTYNASADNADGYSQVKVEVSGGGSVLGEKTISTYGVYNASADNLDGYSKVTNITGLETATASGAVASISDAVAMPCTSVVAQIVPTQSGTGTPSPQNVRPISGFSSAVLTRDGGTGTTPVTFTSNLGRTVYGGTLDFVSGALTESWIDLYFDGSSNVNAVSYHSQSGLYFTTVAVALGGDGYTSLSNINLYSDKFEVATGVSIGHTYISGSGNILVAVLPDQTVTTKEQAKQWFEDNPTHFVYRTSVPNTYSIFPQQIDTLQGVNNFYADTGDTSVSYYREKPPLDLILQDGVVSDTSDYRTATFSDISGYSKIIITFKWESGEQINGVVYDVSAIGNGLNFGVSLQPINVYVDFHLTTTSIASTNYGGSYHNIYATIQGIA